MLKGGFFCESVKEDIKKMIKRANERRALKLIGDLAVKSIKQNFLKGGRPSWKPSGARRTLIGLGTRGGLMGSIHYRLNDKSVDIMTNKPYAAIHHFGGTIKAKNAKNLKFKVKGKWVSKKEVTIPARPYMLLQPEDETKINEIVAKYITEGRQ